MKSIDFLTEHFSAFTPSEPYSYIIFFMILSNKEITNIDELREEIDKIEDKITKNDILLLSSYKAMTGYKTSLLDKAYEFFGLKFIISDYYEHYFIQQLNSMRNYLPSNKNEFNIFKYFFPFILNTRPSGESYGNYIPDIYYVLRSQLIFCKTKNEMIDKLEYDYCLISTVAQRLYHIDDQIINMDRLRFEVGLVYKEVFYYLKKNDEDAKKAYYDNFLNYKKNFNLIEHFGDVFNN